MILGFFGMVSSAIVSWLWWFLYGDILWYFNLPQINLSLPYRGLKDWVPLKIGYSPRVKLLIWGWYTVDHWISNKGNSMSLDNSNRHGMGYLSHVDLNNEHSNWTNKVILGISSCYQWHHDVWMAQGSTGPKSGSLTTYNVPNLWVHGYPILGSSCRHIIIILCHIPTMR